MSEAKKYTEEYIRSHYGDYSFVKKDLKRTLLFSGAMLIFFGIMYYFLFYGNLGAGLY